MKKFLPFANEQDNLALDDLTIENRLDRLEIYGSLQITKDQTGLRLAKELKEIIDAAVHALEGETLPDQLPSPDIERVKNPFG